MAALQFTPSIQSEDTHAIALNLAEQAVGFPVTYIVKDSYISKHNQIRHVYLKQTAADGREIFNADLNINILNKKALNIGHTFYNGSLLAPVGTLSSVDAVKSLLAFLHIDPLDSHVHTLNGAANVGTDLSHLVYGVKGALEPSQVHAGYVQVENGKRLEPVWNIRLRIDLDAWNAYVSMRTGQTVCLYNWVHALNSYQIYPQGINDPDDGQRSVVLSPATTSSPLGWHNQGNGTYYTTVGNNVYAQLNPTGSGDYINKPRPQGGSTLDFVFPIDFTQAPAAYGNASTTNLFVWNNYIHDIFYRYGFDEVSGNFQENNFGKGGKGNDSVIAFAQDVYATDNAFFYTPPDGEHGEMSMGTVTESNPRRDTDLESGIIIHEYTHGISNRLTGGPTNVNCLNVPEAGGMGEGWGDFFATVIRQRSTYTRDDAFPMGAYSFNDPAGIRYFPYSTNFKIDPETYGYINGSAYYYSHAIGEVWATILWETYWSVVDAIGWSPNLYIGEGGNNVLLQVVLDGLKIQPCNPNFVDARNAILIADEVNYSGRHFCLLWKGFATRGLGQYAVGSVGQTRRVKEDFTVPDACK